MQVSELAPRPTGQKTSDPTIAWAAESKTGTQLPPIRGDLTYKRLRGGVMGVASIRVDHLSGVGDHDEGLTHVLALTQLQLIAGGRLRQGGPD